MRLTNSARRYGWISIVMHWSIALVVLGLFVLGLWMTGLDYYHAWYRRGPDLHRSVGALLLLALVGRLLWRALNTKPAPVGRPGRLEARAVAVVHGLLHLLPLALIFSGYLISTADGRPLAVFDWFEVPALNTGIDNLEDLAGDIHYLLALGVMALAGVHALAALKHHFFDRDATLRRMLTPQD